MASKKKSLSTLCSVIFVLFWSCQSPTPTANEIVVHTLADPDMLNPINYQASNSEHIMTNIFQKLLNVDYRTLELVPVLAEDLPEVVHEDNGEVSITYQIRKNAVWDNGNPVTAKDVAFTHKVAMNPLVNGETKRSYLSHIKSIQLYKEDSRKITFVCSPYIRVVYTSGAEISILPEYFYDPQRLMEGFSFEQLKLADENLLKDPNLIAFANAFNSEKYQRDKDFISGSGAYRLHQWKTGQNIILKKKQDWWGDQLVEENNYFEAFPEEITYQVIVDFNTAFTALKAGKIDVMQIARTKDFVELKESKSFAKQFNGYAAPWLMYSFLGLNTTSPELSDKTTRQALAHLMDVNRFIEKNQYGYGERVIGPIHPSDKKYYNHNITPFAYNPEKAAQMLEEAGWKDLDEDGILERLQNGEQVNFEIDFSYNAGNEGRKAVGVMLQEECRKLGIQLNLIPKEWSIYVQDLTEHNFDIFFGAWVGEYAPNDPKQLFHTQSSQGGSNFCSFGNAESDKLIDSIGTTLDENRRAQLWKKLQAIIYEETPYIFMATRENFIAIKKDIKNADPSGMNPGYWEAGFIKTEVLSKRQ